VVSADAVALEPLTSLVELLRARTIGSRELLELYLSRIDRLNPSLNAVVTLGAEAARRRADEADGAASRGDWWGPLHGVPITVKDAIATAGLRTTGGATELADHVPATDATVVARLRAAGAIVFGKTNLPKWSLDYQTGNDLFGVTHNPWDLTRTPGGSSGGAGAAVAAGLTAFEVGTDLGGSVRLPSNWCGVFGFKPTFGAVPTDGYLDRIGGSGDVVDGNHFGPLARGVRDLALVHGVIADDPRGGPDPLSSLDAYRIGTWLDDPAAPVSSLVRDVHRVAVDAWKAGGARIDDSHPAVDFEAARAYSGPFIGRALAGSDPNVDDDTRAALRASWRDWFEHHHALLQPISIVTAPAHDPEPRVVDRTVDVDGVSRSAVLLTAWTAPINVLGLPSAVVPVGLAADGLPVALQVIGPWGHDRRVLDLAARLADVHGGYVPPSLAR
jgi:amidase